jgi:hypothetical protein
LKTHIRYQNKRRLKIGGALYDIKIRPQNWNASIRYKIKGASKLEGH